MHELFDWIYSIVVALFLAMIIHIFLFVPTKVAGSSMYPTLEDGQYLIVSKLGHVFRQVRLLLLTAVRRECGRGRMIYLNLL